MYDRPMQAFGFWGSTQTTEEAAALFLVPPTRLLVADLNRPGVSPSGEVICIVSVVGCCCLSCCLLLLPVPVLAVFVTAVAVVTTWNALLGVGDGRHSCLLALTGLLNADGTA